ncbi:MAG: family 16 glycoside hydrolase, partial [Tunicatimonas sp.]|uniref:family 16 glycoside hydrolase n=1 Tax=Tunicatimonas sp. TaxID=1940096 RepID=UPI003C77F75F
QHITVQDSLVTIRVDGEVVTEYVEPKDVKEDAGTSGRYLDKGTFALQGHDPKSKVYYKNIMVKVLPD